MKFIACLNSDLHEATNPVNEGFTMWVFNFFSLFSNKSCFHEDTLIKLCVYWKGWLLKPYFIFFIFSPMLFDGVLDYMICMINNDAMFTLDYVDIEEIYSPPPPGRCCQREYKFLASSFQIKYDSVFPCAYHMFQLK